MPIAAKRIIETHRRFAQETFVRTNRSPSVHSGDLGATVENFVASIEAALPALRNAATAKAKAELTALDLVRLLRMTLEAIEQELEEGR